jgi:hypothetical protein
MRQGQRIDGRNHDVLLYSLLMTHPGPWRGEG